MSVNRTFPPFVYFVRQIDAAGPVKIGCSQRPEDRLNSFMAWAPYPLRIAAKIPGDEKLERRFHARFAHLHSHREWFRAAPELEATIEAIRLGVFDVDALPAPRALTGRKNGNGWTENARRSACWTHRLRHLEARGVTVPAEVKYSARRWNAGPWHPEYDPHNPMDAQIVEAFLAEHPRLADLRRKAA